MSTFGFREGAMDLRHSTPFGAALLVLATLLPPPAALAAGKAELKTKPGGRVRITHGTPAWNEKFLAEMKPGLNWRLGAGGATTIQTEGALIFDDAVVFPGEYNLALTCEAEGEWALIFHHDGDFYQNQRNSGMTMFRQRGVKEGEEEAKMLLIELSRQEQDAEFPYLLSTRFGPFVVEKPFATAKARTIKGKAGRHPLTSIYLERTDLERMKKAALEDEVCVASLESPSFKGALKLFLRVGEEEVSMVALRDDEVGIPRHLAGQSRRVQQPTSVMTHKIQPGKDGATLIFTIGNELFEFALPAELIERLGKTDSF